MTQAIQMDHKTDPRIIIADMIGDRTDDIAVLGTRVLVAVYERPERSKGGIILTDATRQEDRYQGKVGLVLKMGPLAFSEDDKHRFGDVVPQVGNWVVFRVGDTFGMELGKQRCRSVEDVDIHLIIHAPDAVL